MFRRRLELIFGPPAVHQIFTDFVDFYGVQKFTNVTNGVTPRRWLHQCNPNLAALVTETLGSKAWIKDLTQLSNLKHLANEAEFRERFMAVKHFNKVGISGSADVGRKTFCFRPS